MKIGVCNELFKDWPIERVFSYAAELGYDGVELAPFTLGETVSDISAADRSRIRRAAESAGVEIVGLHWLLVKPGGLYINHPDKEIRSKTQSYLEALIDLCADLGGRVLVHGSPNQRNVQDGWDPAETWNRARETFEICAQAAGTRGVFYCLEALTAADTNFINSFDEALRMVNEIGHPNFQTMFDCRSMSIGLGGNPSRALEKALASGFGDLQFAPLLKVLIDGRYAGYISVEVFDFAPDPETIAGRSIGYLHGLCESRGHSVKRAGF
jgi:D-psicose/D-tagatose/L-ribulose 3-epimerase